MKRFLLRHKLQELSQFNDVSLYDRVSGDLIEDNIGDSTRLTDSLLDPDISTASKNIQVTDSEDTYVTVDSTELLEQLTLQVPVYRALSCPHLNKNTVYKPQVPPIPKKSSQS